MFDLQPPRRARSSLVGLALAALTAPVFAASAQVPEPPATAPAPPAKDPRVEAAFAVLRARPAEAVAFHLRIEGRDVDPVPFDPGEHVLAVAADGSIRCGTMPLLFAGSADERLLRHHLFEVASLMEHAIPVPPGPMALPDERLEVRFDRDASFRSLTKVANTCWMRGIQIWKLGLVPVTDGEPGRAIPVVLPNEVGISCHGPEPITLLVRRLVSSGGRAFQVDASVPVGRQPREGDEDPPPRVTRTFHDRAALREFLAETRSAEPGRKVFLEAAADLTFADVVEILVLLCETGHPIRAFVAADATDR